MKCDLERYPILTVECENCKFEITFQYLLNKYGPEGLYQMADKLKEIADEDVENALTKINN